MKTNKFTLIFGLSLLLLTSCGEKEKEKTVLNSTPVLVTLNTKSISSSKSTISGSGKIEASKSATLSTRMMGFVSKFSVEIGDKVSKGQLLININSSDLIAKKAQITAKINAAESSFNNAKKDFERYTSLFNQQSASQKELDDMSTRYEMTKAGLVAAKEMKNELQAQLAYTSIKAPFDGIITQKFIKEGNMANPGMPLLAIENMSNFQIITTVSETDINKISKDSKAHIIIKSLNKTVAGKIVAISNSAKNSGGQFSVKVALESTDTKILPGMYANVELEISTTSSEKIIVPKSAIVTRGQLSGIYTVSSNNTAILRWLRLGKSFDNQVEVLSGLNANEKYIISSTGKLYNGATISIQ
jgi:RND family efflux transporter MFP subunit